MIFKIDSDPHLQLSDSLCLLGHARFSSTSQGLNKNTTFGSTIRASRTLTSVSLASLAPFFIRMRRIVFLPDVFQPAFRSTVYELFFVGNYVFLHRSCSLSFSDVFSCRHAMPRTCICPSIMTRHALSFQDAVTFERFRFCMTAHHGRVGTHRWERFRLGYGCSSTYCNASKNSSVVTSPFATSTPN